MTESDAFKELLDALCRIETAILGLSSNVNRVADELNGGSRLFFTLFEELKGKNDSFKHKE